MPFGTWDNFTGVFIYIVKVAIVRSRANLNALNLCPHGRITRDITLTSPAVLWKVRWPPRIIFSVPAHSTLNAQVVMRLIWNAPFICPEVGRINQLWQNDGLHPTTHIAIFANWVAQKIVTDQTDDATPAGMFIDVSSIFGNSPEIQYAYLNIDTFGKALLSFSVKCSGLTAGSNTITGGTLSLAGYALLTIQHTEMGSQLEHTSRVRFT